MKKLRLFILITIIALMLPHAAAADAMTACRVQDKTAGHNILTRTVEGTTDVFEYTVPTNGVTMLILYSNSCGNSARVLNALSCSDLIDRPELDVVAVDCNSTDLAASQSFVQSYIGPAAGKFTLWSGGSGILWGYVKSVLNSGSVTFPLVMMVTEEAGANTIRYFSTGYQSLSIFEDALSNLVSSGDSPEEPPSTGIFTYYVEDGGAIITDGSNYGSDLVIPSTIDGFPVTGISYNAFMNAHDIETLYIPEGVTRIGYNAFDTCKNLREVTLPETLETMYSGAFACCTSLHQITIPASVTYLDNGAFAGCTALERIEVAPGSATLSSVDGVVYSADGSTLMVYPAGKKDAHFVVPEGVTELAYGAFYECEVEELTLPDTLSVFTPRSVYRCFELQNFHVSDANPNFTAVDGLLYTKDMTTVLSCPAGRDGTVTVPEGVTRVEHYTFGCCGLLDKINLPDTVTYIGSSAFEQCLDLLELKLPAQLKEIGSYAFYMAVNLNTLILPAGLETVHSTLFENYVFEFYFQGDAPVLSNGSGAVSGRTIYRLPDSSGWDAGTWANATLLEWDGVHFPLLSGTAYTLGGGRHPWELDRTTGTLYFNGTEFLYWIQYVGGDWGNYLSWVRHIVLGDQTVSVGQASLGCFPNLESLTIPGSVYSLPADAFTSCSSPIRVEVASGNPYYYSRDGLLYTADHFLLYAGGLEGKTSFAVPSHTRGVGYYAFVSTNLEKLTLPSSMDTSFTGLRCPTLKELHISGSSRYTTVDGVLYDKNMTELLCCPNGKTGRLVVPDTVTFIGVYAFSYSSVSEVILPDGLGSIAQYAFRGSTGLESIVIPGTVQRLGQRAFSECSALREFTVEEGVTKIESTVLYDCPALERVVFPDSLTEMGTYVCGECPALWDVDLGDGLAMLPRGTFSNCKSLTSITLPRPMIDIEDLAFEYCTNLRAIYAAGASPAATSNIFYGCDTLPTVYYRNGDPTWQFPLGDWIGCPLAAWEFPERAEARLTDEGLVLEFSGVCAPSSMYIVFYSDDNRMVSIRRETIMHGRLDPIALPRGATGAKVFFLYSTLAPRHEALTAT